MTEIIKPGVNGFFTNGSVEDVARLIDAAKGINWKHVREQTSLPTLDTTARRWLDFFKKAAA